MYRSLYGKLLDNPSAYGFTDVNTTEGNFWFDAVHPRTKVHEYMAADLVGFLQNQAASRTNPATSSTTAKITTFKNTTSSAPASNSVGAIGKHGQW